MSANLNVRVKEDRWMIGSYHQAAIRAGIGREAPYKIGILSPKADNTPFFREIAARFKVHQWDRATDAEFGDHDLFFWCTSNPDGSRDLTYADYSLNERRDTARTRQETADEIVAIARANAKDGTTVTVMYGFELDPNAAREMAVRRLAEIGTRKVEYNGMTGRFDGNRVFGRTVFHEQGTRKYYYLDDLNVCLCRVVDEPKPEKPRKASNETQLMLF